MNNEKKVQVIYCFLVGVVGVIVLLYVRQEAEEVFDALMLNSPTLRGLRQAVGSAFLSTISSLFFLFLPSPPSIPLSCI